MLCQECGKAKASVHLTRIVDGKKTETYLCEHCAQQKGEWGLATEPISLQNFFSSFLGMEPQVQPKVEQKGISCEQCGLTFQEFRQRGRLGCDACYESLGASLHPLLKRIHGRDEHRGKIPQKAGGRIRTRREIQDLRQSLQEAIQEERFEEAATLRDQIKDLERELEG